MGRFAAALNAYADAREDIEWASEIGLGTYYQAKINKILDGKPVLSGDYIYLRYSDNRMVTAQQNAYQGLRRRLQGAERLPGHHPVLLPGRLGQQPAVDGGAIWLSTTPSGSHFWYFDPV